MTQPVELVLIGAGHRGADAYAPYALEHPDQARFVAVAEPNVERRQRFAQKYGIPGERCFTDWKELLARGQIGEGALVCTQDQMHVAPAVAAMEAGYDVLLEKPMAHTLAGCVQLVQASDRTGRMLLIGHVLRYTHFFRRLHDILASGRLGDLVTVEQRENVAYWHMAHSFVRGNWGNSALSSPMILAKCCHDMDVLYWNLGRPCVRLSSFGSLLHFRADQVGPEIPGRCTDNCPIERQCAFSAIGIYLDLRPFPEYAGQRATPLNPNPTAPDRFPINIITPDLSYEGRLKAIQTGPYGRCVYRSDNDVVDHQVVSMEFSGGTSVVLVMHGHSNEEHRSMRYDGTRATLRARFGHPSEITIYEHASGEVERVPFDLGGGHGGGDEGLMEAFVRAVRGEGTPPTNARASLESHLMAFAAEEARVKGTIVQMDEFRKRAGGVKRDA